MKPRSVAIIAALLLTSSPAFAAEITWNGLVTQTINQANTRIDAFQAANANVIPAATNTQINGFQTFLIAQGNAIKATNPVPNGLVPSTFPTFTIPALPNLPH